MTAVERDNPSLRDVLPKGCGRDALDKQRLGQVVDLASNIRVGGAEAQADDVLGPVYEYFLEQFALAEGRKGGEFYIVIRAFQQREPVSVDGDIYRVGNAYQLRNPRNLSLASEQSDGVAGNNDATP